MKTFFITILAAVAFVSCKKEDMSKYATKEDLNNITSEPTTTQLIESIDLEVYSWEWEWNSLYNQWEYTLQHDFIGDGVLVGYLMTAGGKNALPYYNALTGVTFGLVDATFSDEILITSYDGSSNLSAPTSTMYFYLKIIPASLVKSGVNYNNIEEVFAAHDLKH